MSGVILGTRKRKTNLSESAYSQIKDAICAGEIAPGDILSETYLAESLGMSRTPVREALRALASEDFVEIRSGIGAYVKQISSRDMEDLYEVRCLLELQAITTSITRISDAEIDELEKQFRALYDACERGEHPSQGEFSDLDWSLHILLVSRCTNNYIKKIISEYDTNLRRYQSLSAQALNDVKESARQHLEILKVLRTRDLPKLTEILKAHLDWSVSLLQVR